MNMAEYLLAHDLGTSGDKLQPGGGMEYLKPGILWKRAPVKWIMWSIWWS